MCGDHFRFVIIIDKRRILSVKTGDKQELTFNKKYKQCNEGIEPSVRIFTIGKMFDLEKFNDMCEAIKMSINACRMCLSLSQQTISPFTLERNGSKGILKTTVTRSLDKDMNVGIVKTFTVVPERKTQLIEIYNKIEAIHSGNLPGHNHLPVLSVSWEAEDECRLDVKPACFHYIPRSGRELADAVMAVLRALRLLHEKEVYHCDVRWPNVMRAHGSWDWVLIDFECARPANELLGDLKKRPYDEKSGSAADMWYVGDLMVSEQCEVLLNDYGRNLAQLLLAPLTKRITLEKAIGHEWFNNPDPVIGI